MLNLRGENVYLRALEPDDLEFLFSVENHTEIWEISNTITPYSKHVLNLYLENAHRDIYDVKQLRLGLCNLNDDLIGLVDLFDFDPKNHRAGLGIVILDERQRNQGLGAEAISLTIDYAFSALQLRQLFANVLADNEPSIHIFKKLGFEAVGTKKEWVYCDGKYKDEILFQKINT